MKPGYLLRRYGEVFARFGCTPTRVRPNGCFARARRGPGTRPVHLIFEAAALWDPNRLPRIATLGRCGAMSMLCDTFTEVPAEYELCDRCILADYQPAVIYRFVDATGAPLYIGQSCDLLARLCNHSTTAEWWPLVDRCEFEIHPRNALLTVEATAIRTEQPRFNVKHNPAASAA